MIARHITHRFGDRVALDDVTVEVPAGEVVGLLGPNGAGKTTLMRILFGVLVADAGEVFWGGRPATAADRREWGYMPQERGLYRDMRVVDHLVWIARLHGLGREQGHRQAMALLHDLGIGDRADDEVKELSGGMAQRMQLAAAMVHDPPMLVLDEPFAGLDPAAVEFLSGVVTRQAARGGYVLFSSHQLDLVEDMCESIVMIDRGRVVLEGTVRELKERSHDRYLRVDVAVADDLANHLGCRVSERNASGTRLRLPPGGDAFEILQAVRARSDVHEFAVESPALSELFRDATRGSGTAT